MSAWVCIIIIVYLAVLVVCARQTAPSEGYYSTVTVFGVSAFIYYMAIPIEMALFDEEIRAAGDLVFLSPAQQVQISLMGLLAFVAFLVGYRFSKFVPFEGEEPADGPAPAARPAGRIPKSLLILGAGSVVLLVLGFAPQLRSMSTYAGAYETAYEHPVFSLLRTYAVMAAALTAAVLVCRHRARPVLALIVVTPVFSWGVFSSDKDPILIGLLGLAAYFLGKRSRSPKLLLWIGGCAVALMLLSPVFSMYRSGYTLSEAWHDYYFGVTKSDPRGPMISMAVVTAGDQPPAWGHTYLNNALLWIPKFVWPERPLDLSEAFARDNMSDWSPGRGLGYSLLAEAYVNFWWFGPLIQYFLIGLLWGKVWALIRRAFSPVSAAYWSAVYGVFGFYLLTIMHRGPTPGITKTMLQILAPLVLLTYIFDRALTHPARVPTPVRGDGGA
ncbi:MAG: O-antigen polymerase [Planctomycetota bacterium]